MSPELIDELLDALMADACARGGDRLALVEQEAICLRGDEELQRRPLDWRITGALVRRAMLGAGLDPWQFKRTQTGRLAGRWELTVEGEDLHHRRVTIRPREPVAVREGAAARLDAVTEKFRAQLAAAARRTEDEASETELLTAEDSPIIILVNLMLKDAFSLGVRRIVASPAGGQLVYPDGSAARQLDWPPQQWREIRGRLLYMCGLQPWERGPLVSGFRLRFYGGHFASWRVDVPEGDGLVELALEAEPVEPAVQLPPPSQQPPAEQTPLSEALRAVLDAPGDLARRAVYADSLLERGDPRGRFIALQLAGRGAPATPAQLGEWCGTLRDLCVTSGARFAWGFVDRLVMTRTTDFAQLPAVVHDAHWATVRGLKLQGIGPKLAGRILEAAPLSSLVALALEAPLEPAASPVLARLDSLSVSGLNLALAEWLDQLALPKLSSLELALEDHVSAAVVAEKLRRFFALKAAHVARDLIVDWRAHPTLWPNLAALPASVERVSLPFLPQPFEDLYLSTRAPYPEALVCTLQRASPDASFAHAVLYGDVDALYRSAGDVLTALAPYPSLELVRLVSKARALDRGREGVLRRTCAEKLPRVRVEVAVGEPEAPLWWLAETPPR